MPPQDYRQIRGPDGLIKFPSSMSDSDVEKAMGELYPAKQINIRPTSTNQYQAVPGSDSPQAQAARMENIYSFFGQAIPQGALPILAKAKQYLVDPFNRMAEAGGKTFSDIGQATVGLPSWFTTKGQTEQQAFQQAAQQHPIATGVARGVGGVVGSTATDPRNWPLLAASTARPILQRLISGGFATQMGTGALQGAQQLHDNWDKLTPSQRAEYATQTGLSALMATASAGHALREAPKSPLADLKKELVKSETSTSPSLAQSAPETKTAPAPSTQEPSAPTSPPKAPGEPIQRTEGPDLGPGFRYVRDMLTNHPEFAQAHPELQHEVQQHLAMSAAPEEWMSLGNRVQRAWLADQPTKITVPPIDDPALQDITTAQRGRAKEIQEKYRNVAGIVLSEDLAKEIATKAPQVAGTVEGAKADTAFFAQAKAELPGGSLSDWAKRAQELKSQQETNTLFAERTKVDEDILKGRGLSDKVGPLIRQLQSYYDLKAQGKAPNPSEQINAIKALEGLGLQQGDIIRLLHTQKRMETTELENLFKPKPPSGERGSSTLAASPFGLAREAKQKLENLYQTRFADPVIEKVLKLGRTHGDVEAIDPDFTDKLRDLDHGPKYFKMKAESIINQVVGPLNRDQERLFVLMADRDSRINLQMNHPDEYAAATNDPEIGKALARYKPYETALTEAYKDLGGTPLEHDYLRRVYEEHTSGINRQGKVGETIPPSFDRIIRPQRADGKQRIEDAEHYYQNGLHEFGPSFGTKYVGTAIKLARDRVARDFLSKATKLSGDDLDPQSIDYNGKTYYSREAAADMRRAGAKNVAEYGTYSQGLRFYPIEKIDPRISTTDPVRAGLGVRRDETRYLAPKELTDAMNGLDNREEGKPSEIKRFFQEQVVGLGFGIPHYMNIVRRVAQSAPGGVANPLGWARAMKVSFSSELKARGLSGLEDPTFDMLARQGAISTQSQVSEFKRYVGGNFNPANWVKPFSKIGHDFLFNPGGIDQRARLYIADLIKSQHPEYSDARIAQGVNEQLGNYNRQNWTGFQKQLGKFLLFPGWDMSSAAWVVRHPIRTSIPPALLIFMANRAINSMGGNKESDKQDIFAIHFGERTFSPNVLSEPFGKMVGGPALRTGEAIIQHKSWNRAVNEGLREFWTKDLGKPVSMLRPDVQLPFEIKLNKDLGTGKDITKQGDWNRRGQYSPLNRYSEKMAWHITEKLVPQIGRASEAWDSGKFDWKQLLGSNMGIYNFADDPVASLKRKISSANTFIQARKESTTPLQLASAFHQDPDATVYLATRSAAEAQLKRLNDIDLMRQRVEDSQATPERKKELLTKLDKFKDDQIVNARKLDTSIEEILRRSHEAKKLALQ